MQISFKPEGKVLTFPGIPPIYDYEVWAQDVCYVFGPLSSAMVLTTELCSLTSRGT